MTSGFEILREILGDRAGFQIVFDRNDEDKFSLNVSILTGVNKNIDRPPDPDLIDLLPEGSNWSQALGWRSFFGTPYEHEDQLWLALGLVKILKHDHRGAFPRSEIFLVNFESENLGELVHRIGKRVADVDKSEDPVPRHGALVGDAVHPSEHRKLEGQILRGAAYAYEDDSRLLFRTAVLTENEIPDPRFLRFFSSEPSDNSPLHFTETLYGTIPTIYQEFRWASKLQVFLEQGRSI